MFARPAARAALGLYAAMLFAAWLLIPSRRPVSDREMRRGLGIAVLGNGRLLAAEDAEGTIVDLFWPRPGELPQITSGSGLPKRPPDPAGGLYAGIEIGGRLRWLRDAPRIISSPAGYPAVMITRFEFADGLVVV